MFFTRNYARLKNKGGALPECGQTASVVVKVGDVEYESTLSRKNCPENVRRNASNSNSKFVTAANANSRASNSNAKFVTAANANSRASNSNAKLVIANAIANATSPNSRASNSNSKFVTAANANAAPPNSKSKASSLNASSQIPYSYLYITGVDRGYFPDKDDFIEIPDYDQKQGFLIDEDILTHIQLSEGSIEAYDHIDSNNVPIGNPIDQDDLFKVGDYIYIINDTLILRLRRTSKGGANRKKKKQVKQRVLYRKHAKQQPNRHSIVHLDSSGRKYIKVNGSQVYLDTIRGRYRYVDV